MEHTSNRIPIFTERFRELQGDRNNTEFAVFLGISRQTVGFYCNGERTPDVLTLMQIARKCQVSTDWLLGLSREKTYNADVQKVCNYTGLSSSAVAYLAESKDQHPQIDVCNFLLEKKSLITYIVNYFSAFVLKGITKPPFKYIPIKENSLYPFMSDVHFATIIRTLQRYKTEFEGVYENDESFEENAIYAFLRRHADIRECERIVWGDDFCNYLTDEELEEIRQIQAEDPEYDALISSMKAEEENDRYEQESEKQFASIAGFLNSIQSEHKSDSDPIPKQDT